MDTTHFNTPPELVFPPQVPFSWTLRWARAHGADARSKVCTYRISGMVRTEEELADAVAFARRIGARLELG